MFYKFLLILTFLLNPARAEFLPDQVIKAEDFNTKFSEIKTDLNNRGLNYSYNSFNSAKEISSSKLNENFDNFKLLVPEVELYVFQPQSKVKAAEINHNFDNINLLIQTVLSSRPCSDGIRSIRLFYYF